MRKLLHISLAAFLICLLPAGWSAQPAAAQSGSGGGQVVASADYLFGEKITFIGAVSGETPPASAHLFFKTQGEVDTRDGEAAVSGQELLFELPLNQGELRAFAQVEYWFEVQLADGSTLESSRQAFLYEDNRFDWQTRQADDFRVHYYEGDAAFGQSALDVAVLGRENIQRYLPLSLAQPVDIYAYASAQAMRETLLATGQTWVGAHTHPDLSVMVVSLPPGPEQRLEMERQIPHELMHILLYQQLGPAYANLPSWLNEGLASAAELYPNPDYLILIEKAREEENLLPMASLCAGMPREASAAFLAYAQSASFVRFLHQEYGVSGMQGLVEAYANGVDCERGLEVATGSSLVQLERDWRRQTLGENPLGAALGRLAPWLFIGGLFLTLMLGAAFFSPAGKREDGRGATKGKRRAG